MPSHDVMPNMELYQPTQVEDALAIADRLAERGWLVGGGQDTPVAWGLAFASAGVAVGLGGIAVWRAGHPRARG